MELTKLKKRWTDILQKYKYVILIAVIGVVLMLLPSSNKSPKKQTVTEKKISGSTQEDLENILSQIDGAGSVQVLLREGTGEETIYQTNAGGSSGSDKLDTVIVTDADRNEAGLIRQINPPGYIGAIILCQGAENPTVKLAIADAVSKITGLGLDKIAVLKMK